MSLTLNMVGGGSGGGISGNTAVLEVVAPVGSSVSITNGTTTKTQTAADGHPVSDRPTVEAYIFPVGADELGTWTITATRETETNTTTVTISAIMSYVAYIGYHVPIGQYQEVEYIGTSNSALLRLKDTTIHKNVHIIARAASSVGNNDGLISVLNSNSWTGSIRTEIYNNNSNYITYTYPGTDGLYLAPFTPNELVEMEFVAQEGQGVTWKIGEYTNHENINFAATNRLYIFYYQGTSQTYKKGRIQHIELYEDGVLTRDCWSCYRLSDSVAGMWDKVTETFFANASGVSGSSFYVGSDVS